MSLQEQRARDSGWLAERPLSIALGIFQLFPRGGREGLCLQIAEKLRARGHRVTIMVADDAGEAPFEVVRVVHPALIAYKPERIRMFARGFSRASRRGFDRTVAFHAMPADVALLVDNAFHQPDTSFLKRIGPRYRAFVGRERACMQAGARTRVIGLSGAQMAPFVSQYGLEPERLAILPPTVDPGCRQSRPVTDRERLRLRAELGVFGDAPLWLWIGLQPIVKGLDRVVETLALAPDARLLVCGIEADHKKMRPILRQAAAAGVADRISCLGFVPNRSDRFYEILAAADVLVHPARNDTTGTVILEALVNGLPVAASAACGYSGHILESGAGAVPEGEFDARVWRDALSSIVANRPALAKRGVDYGRDPLLYSGVTRAVELIEAPLDEPWPTMSAT